MTGHLSAGVPGAVAGLTEAHRKYGRLPFAAVIAHRRSAWHTEGFVVDEYRRRSIGEDSARLVLFPASRATYLPDDRPPVPGSTFGSRSWGRPSKRSATAAPKAFIDGWVADPDRGGNDARWRPHQP